MFWIIAVLLLIPCSTWIWLRRSEGNRHEAVRIVLLTAVCGFISGPFLTERGLGTGEAANYSLAVADTVLQMREGVFPVFVGQSEYAFNGRVHPLRTAVYFTHAAGILDLITFRQLSFWGLQNLSLALSLWGAVFAMYVCLRRTASSGPWVSSAIAFIYGCSPGLLAPAYGMDLYMTVTAAPFLPIAFHGAAMSFSVRRFSHYATMAVGLAGVWLAHPPVAAWASLACGVVVALSWMSRRPELGALLALAAGAVVGAALSAWAFASALSLREGIVDAGTSELIAKTITSTTADAGWAGLLPATGAGTKLADYQLGYAGWAMLAIMTMVAVRRGVPGLVRALLCAGLFLLLLTLPVPFLHEWLWQTLPSTFGMLTNSWPMQRAYLVVSALACIGFSHAWAARPPAFVTSRRPRVILLSIAAVLLVWTGWQASTFTARGYATRLTEDRSNRLHASANIDITGVAYAFLGVPRSYYHGTRDPEQELQILSLDLDRSIVSNQTSLLPSAGATTGELISSSPPNEVRHFAQTITLDPGRRYRLTLEFKTPPIPGVLVLTGDSGLYREYKLPDSGSPRGFGLGEERHGVLTIWTDAATPEQVSLALHPGDPAAGAVTEFATYRLEEIDRATLPLKLTQLSPTLKISVDAPESGWLETPRLFVPGYTALVDGRAVEPRRSKDRLTIIPVDAGRHDVELRYTGSPTLRAASTLTLACWAGLVAGLVGLGILQFGYPELRARLVPEILVRRVVFVTVALIAIGFAVYGWDRWKTQRPTEPGPLLLSLALPADAIGKAEPLVSAGQGPGSVTVFVRYVSERTIRVGVDVWGYGPRESEDLAINYANPVEIMVSAGFFYDLGQTELTDSLGSEHANWLRGYTRLWVNGAEALLTADAPRVVAPTRWGVLRAITGDGNYQHRFSGSVLETRWLSTDSAQVPFPTSTQLNTESGPLRLRIKLPKTQTGQAEPILSIGEPGTGSCVFIHYLDDRHIRIGIEGPGANMVTSGPVAVDYDTPLAISISLPSLFHSSTGLAGYSVEQARSLRERLRVAVDGRWVVSSAPALSIAGSPIRFAINSVEAKYPGAGFSGRMLGTDRVPSDQWPIPPGNPEAATAAGAAGPIEITTRLPLEMTGRQQPLFVIGKPGEGTLVFAHYLDRDHIRIGVDVWNKALFWSQPIPTDYLAPQRIRIAMTSLFPEAHPEVQALDPAARERLRNTLSVAVNDTVVINETIAAYDSAPEQMTPGRSEIGGSNHEAAFLGDILEVKRLPVTPP
ncbi:MAG TPA: hypothetical protein VGD88_14075 [Opitutaceae bacterium]